MKNYVSLLSMIFLGSLLSCASSPVLTLGDNSLVRYLQFNKSTGEVSLEMLLIDENHTRCEKLWKEAKKHVLMKTVPHQKYQQLLEFLEDNNFLKMATPSAPGTDARFKGGSKAIMVEDSTGQWTLHNTKEFSVDQHMDMIRMYKEILDRFDFTDSPSVTVKENTKEEGADIFMKEQQKLQENNRKRAKK